MRTLFLFPVLTVAACGSTEAPVAGNDTARITNQIEQQAKEIQSQADNGAAAIEQALENEGAVVFENRDALLNESGNGAAAAGDRER